MRPCLLFCVLAACSSTDEPALDRIEPARVTSLVATPAVVTGVNLAAVASIDLDSDRAATLDRGWRLHLGATELSNVTWRDRENLDAVIPGGIAPGSYDVIATSPAGTDLVLPNALTVTDDPLGLLLSIESAPGGGGSAVTADLMAGDTLSAYAVVRDDGGVFIADTSVQWQLAAPIGTLVNAVGNATLLNATTVGTGLLHARHDGADLDADSGEVAVHAGPPAKLRIVDGNGAPIGSVAGLTTDPDGGLAARAVAYDAHDNVTGDTVVGWSVAGVTAATVPNSTTAAIDFTTPGTGTVIATHASLGTAMTGDLMVSPGRAATLAVTPPTSSMTADSSPVAFTATATDADGNATTNVGTLTWSVASGPITSLDPTTGTLDPIRAGTGTVRVSSSHGPIATSGAITIGAGAPATVVVSPPSLTTDADATPTQFTAAISDADGNAVAQSPAWSVASGTLGSLGVAGLLNPTTAGSGMIAATAGSAVGTAFVTIAPGRAVSLAVAPDTADVPQGGAPLAFGVSGVDQDGNATTNLGTVTWSLASGTIGALDASGVLTPVTPGTGYVRVSSTYGAVDDTQAITIRRRAALSPTLSIAAPLSLGGRATATLTLNNTGESVATNVGPCTPSPTSGLSIASSATPAMIPSIAAGSSATFTWQVDATATGGQQVTGCATGSDGATSAAITSGIAQGSVTVLTPAALAAAISLPSIVGRGAAFTIALDVTNTGEASANTLTPALSFTGPGVALVSGPGTSTPLAGGASTTLTWTYRATATGTLQVTADAQAVDAGNGQSIASAPDTASTDVVEAVIVATDPFGDGSSFGFVTAHRDRIVIGPNRTGTTVASFDGDGTSAGPPQTFLFAQDVTGNLMQNNATPYRSLGAAGCIADTAACGPDNENGRGTLTGVTLGGVEWLVAQSARDNKGSDYLYMTSDNDANLDFRYVDLRSETPGETFGSSALFALGNILYIGQVGKGGAGPVLLALSATPNSPGLDATNVHLSDLEADKFPGMSATVTTHEKIDTLSEFGGLLYLANPGAWVRATVAVPRRYGNAPSDWAVITPSAPAYTARTSRTTTKLVDLTPADRGVPQMAAFGGRLFVARNTTVGPQLWSCSPAASGVPSQCDAGDWSLVAPNTTGDTLLTQFDAPLTSITMVTATADYLYVGFDSPSGVRVMRTNNSAASTQAHFERDYGGAGLGDATNTKILDGKALTVGGSTAVWITVAGTGALNLVKLP